MEPDRTGQQFRAAARIFDVIGLVDTGDRGLFAPLDRSIATRLRWLTAEGDRAITRAAREANLTLEADPHVSVRSRSGHANGGLGLAMWVIAEPVAWTDSSREAFHRMDLGKALDAIADVVDSLPRLHASGDLDLLGALKTAQHVGSLLQAMAESIEHAAPYPPVPGAVPASPYSPVPAAVPAASYSPVPGALPLSPSSPLPPSPPNHPPAPAVNPPASSPKPRSRDHLPLRFHGRRLVGIRWNRPIPLMSGLIPSSTTPDPSSYRHRLS